MPDARTIKPDRQTMLEWRDELEGEWTPPEAANADERWSYSLDQAQAAEEDLYFQRFDVEAPNGKMGFRTGSAASDADAAIDSLVPVDVLVTVRRKRDRKKYQTQAEKLQKFGKALLLSWSMPRNEWRRVISDQVIRRVGVFRVLYDKTLWPDYPDKYASPPEKPENWDVMEDDAKETWQDTYDEWEDEKIAWENANRKRVPITMQQRNARIVRWRDDDKGELLVVVENYQTTVLNARAAYEDAFPDRVDEILDNRSGTDIVTVSDVWYKQWRGVFIEDRPLFTSDEDDGVLAHGYPQIPYFIVPFRELPFEAPELRYRGMLTNSLDLYPMESQILTMNVWMLAWNAWRTWIGWMSDDREIVIEPGKFFPVDQRKGEYIQMLEGRPVPPELLQMASVADSYIQRNGVSQGPRTVEGTRSGTQVWAIQAMRQMKIEAAKEALQMAMTRALSFAVQILETMVEAPLTLPVPGKDKEGKDFGEVTLDPKDIKGYYNGFTINFSRRLDPAVMEQAKALMMMATNNWMPMRQSYELSGLTDNPQEWIDELLDQATGRMDFMLEFMALGRAKEYFGEDSPEYKLLFNRVYEESQQKAMGQMGGGGGAPPGAPGVPSGGGLTPASPHGPLSEGTNPKPSSEGGAFRSQPPPSSPTGGGPTGGGGSFGV